MLADCHRYVLPGRKLCTEDPQDHAGKGDMVFVLRGALDYIAGADEARDEFRLRTVVDVFGRTELIDLADIHDSDEVGGRHCFGLIVGDIDRGVAIFVVQAADLDANLREEMRFEIRRLHDEYRYTTVYVTHDQSEAMTTADLIAVMNGGRIDQLGMPEEIYDRPQSEFVARFIGSSNVIKGVARDENHIAFCGATLRVVGAKLTANQHAAVAIRQHDIQLSTTAPQTSDNSVKATVTRQVFLGANRDYMLETADGTMLRAVTSTQTAVASGTEVWLTLPAERCRALSR